MSTDYVLALETIFLGILLIKNGATLPVKLWALSFFVLAIAAITGGTYHGFIESLDAGVAHIIWKTTLLSIGVATLLMVSAAVSSFLNPPWRTFILFFAMLQFCAYAFVVFRSDDFRFVIYDYVPAMVLIVALAYFTKARSSAFIITAVALSFGSAAIQQSGVQLHKHFNHNDIYHIIQMIGMYFFYRAGQLL